MIDEQKAREDMADRILEGVKIFEDETTHIRHIYYSAERRCRRYGEFLTEAALAASPYKKAYEEQQELLEECEEVLKNIVIDSHASCNARDCTGYLSRKMKCSNCDYTDYGIEAEKLLNKLQPTTGS